jgi:hypothetical protein
LILVSFSNNFKKVIEASVLTPPPSIDKIYFLSTFYILTVGYLTIRLV